MVAAIPEKYPIASGLIASIGPGDKQLGLQMLRISANRAQYAAVEAKYALLDILSNMEGNHAEALQIAQELHAKYPGNPVFHRYLAKSYYMTSDFAAADTAYHEILRRVRTRQYGYEATVMRQALYYIGDIRLRSGDYTTAARVLEEVAQQSRRLDRDDETSWRTMATLKLGNVYDVLGKRKDAVRQYREVLDRKDFNNAHSKAKEYIAKAYTR
jgi:tetratricopeptide (TPR) repeat protein